MPSNEQSDGQVKRYGKFAINLLVVTVILGGTLTGAGYAAEHFGILAALPVLAGGYIATMAAEYYSTGDVDV